MSSSKARPLVSADKGISAPSKPGRAARDADGFAAWLRDLGLAAGTVDAYASDAAIALEAGGFIARLRDDALAPKTRHRILSAGRRWAEYADDTELARELRRFRLPPARRRAAKVPIERLQLHEVVDEIGRAEYLDAPTRAILGMLACRGFRCGDVLRVKRAELATAKATGILSYEGKGRKWLQFKLLPTFSHHVVSLADQPGEWNSVEDILLAIAGSRCAAERDRRRTAARVVEQALADVGKRCGVPDLHPHKLRRTYAVEYLRSMAGDPEALVKLIEHMQWSSINTAMEYVGHSRGAELDAAAARIFER